MRQKHLRSEVLEQRTLLEEALEEPSLRIGPSSVDLHRAIESIRGMWQCAVQIESMLASFGRSGYATSLLVMSQDKCTELMQCVLDTAEHMQHTLSGATAKMPPSLFRLLHGARAFDTLCLEQLDNVRGLSENDKDEDRAHDVIALGALLGCLQVLSEHTAEMAWRIVALVQKERPSSKDGGSDLYDFEIAV